MIFMDNKYIKKKIKSNNNRNDLGQLELIY